MLNFMRNWEAASKTGAIGLPGEADVCPVQRVLQSCLTSPMAYDVGFVLVLLGHLQVFYKESRPLAHFKNWVLPLRLFQQHWLKRLSPAGFFSMPVLIIYINRIVLLFPLFLSFSEHSVCKIHPRFSSQSFSYHPFIHLTVQ